MSRLHKTAIVLVPFLFAGCGECVFDGWVTGVVTNGLGLRLEGAELTTCDLGHRCDAGDNDENCHTVATDANGEFAIEVSMCRPESFECELRPILVEHEGCSPSTIQLPLSPGPQDVPLNCGRW